MKANQSERLRRSKEFEVGQNRWRANQIETMIAAFDRMCIDLGHQIEAEEKRARISGLETERSVRVEDRGAGVSRGRIRRSALRRRPERWQDARTWRPRTGHAAEYPVVWPLG
jgi:hypothetical protein